MRDICNARSPPWARYRRGVTPKALSFACSEDGAEQLHDDERDKRESDADGEDDRGDAHGPPRVTANACREAGESFDLALNRVRAVLLRPPASVVLDVRQVMTLSLVAVAPVV
jgi:hypothetical protein